MNAISPASLALAPFSGNPLLQLMLRDVAAAARGTREGRDRAVAEALAPHLAQPGLLAGVACPCDPARYTRHLLHADPDGRYAVVAIAWRPGQMSPVHGHRTWCALGIARGMLTETFFERDGAQLCPVGCVARRPGEVSHAPASPDAIHRIANLGTADALSVHVYGVAFDDFGDGVNHVWAA
jgi:predicted metal-dependent enzyme (double-stranded beta helix superfamily)